jgi:DNA-binding GntR family transcriptional regulator
MSVLSRTVLREQVKEVLLARILEGTYAPGDRLVETRIAQELGTSQAPVREALRELELLRFVESKPYVGARVRELSEEELAEIYPVRAAIEEVAAREATARLGGRVERLAAELEAMREAADADDLHGLVEADVRFHRLIVEASGNRTLLEVWSSLRVEARTIITVLATGVDRRELAEMHRPILDALARGDPGEAGQAVREHVEHFGRMLKDGRST